MLLSHSHQFIFIHICKTAGTSLRAVLEPYTRSVVGHLWTRLRSRVGRPQPEPRDTLSAHARAVDARAELPAEVFSGYFKFAFVRNPWDWQVSWYHYILQNREHHEHHAVRELGSFEEFLSWRIDHPVWCQKDYVTDERGEEIVDFVGRFESIEADFAHICEVANLKAGLPHLNRSRHRDYRTYYSDHACRLLEEISGRDIDYFGYRFDPEDEALDLEPLHTVNHSLRRAA
jgi:hypothetical protein